jgi:hypothetical protein
MREPPKNLYNRTSACITTEAPKRSRTEVRWWELNIYFNSHLLPIKLLHVSVKLNSKEDKSLLLPAVDHYTFASQYIYTEFQEDL